MAIQVGILGLGFMGKCHLDAYAKVRGATVAAVCDVEKGRVAPYAEGADSVRAYTRAAALFEDPSLDVIDICLPTYLHARNTRAALEAGKHVICEKPMARDSKTAKGMVAAAQKSGRRLFMAHCIRFWPSYAKARDLVLGGKYGEVRSARFCRLSPLPDWSWKNWLHQPAKSGLCALDLHIHDADFIQYLLGKPKAVVSQGGGRKRGWVDHIVTAYDYGADKLVTAEGAWEYPGGYPFTMTFTIAMEKATLIMGPDLKLALHTSNGKSRELKVPKGDGYQAELQHFVDCIRKDVASDVVSPESAMHSVKLIEAELASLKTSKRVVVRF